MTQRRAASLIDQLTPEEQVSLLSGADSWSLPAIPRLGLGRLRVTDGPNGARGGGNLSGGVPSAAFPVGIALGASWDPALAREIGAALAQEVRDKGAHVLLAPTVNLQRGALNGRNFECYSEDPVLTARLAVAYIGGLQENGVGATVKHFVGNESEVQRTTMSSEIDERTLRELYLVPFEAAVTEAGTWAVMTSYNRLGGTYTSEHRWLLGEVLRGEWCFDGLVMSDWFGSHSTAATVTAGLDLEMPGPTRDRGDKLLSAMAAGEVGAEEVRAAALNVLRLMERTGALDDTGDRVEMASDRAETRALIRRAGAAGAVLLKNEGALPLRAGSQVALIGPNAAQARCMGGGSAQLNAHRLVSPLEGLVAALGEDAVTHAPGCTNQRFEPVLQGPLTAEFFDNLEFAGAPVHVEEMATASAFLLDAVGGGKVDPAAFSVRISGRFVSEVSGTHRVGVHSAGLARVLIDGAQAVEAWESWERGTTFFEEGCDERVGEVELVARRAHAVVVEFRAQPVRALGVQAFEVGIGRPMGDAEIAEAVRVAAAADVAVLCVGRSAEWDSEGADLPSMTLPGRQDELVAAVAAAAKSCVVVLQSGGPVEMPWVGEVDAILQAWYPGQEAGHAIADVLTGRREPGGRLPQSFPRALTDTPTYGHGTEVYPGRDGRVVYAEGLEIGYRHHARSGIAPLYPFGHGLGYAKIDIAGLRLDDQAFENDNRLSVGVIVHNTGSREGCQVVQIYVAPETPPVSRPVAELKAFAKVRLEPGARQVVTLELHPRDFAFFDVTRAAWVVAPGRYGIRAGLSAADARHEAHVVAARERVLPR